MLRTVLIADLVESTQFVERLGDGASAALLQRLDLQIRDLLVFTNGRLIDKADGLLALFERPVQAVDFALRYQHALSDLSAEAGMELKARIGIHVGDVMTWVNTPQAVAAGAKPLEVEGLAKPVAARLMSLAMPGQILMSGMAQTLAHRAQSELGERATKLRWLVHGRYRFKGVPAPMIVHEVGEPGRAPLRLPPSGQKSWREVPLWRRPPVLALEALAVVGLLGGALYTTLRSPPALAFGERDWVVVGDMNNFTGDARLDDSLETAFRVSLEQSRYVNLVSDLKVRDALQRMGRDPKTVIDRSVGSEIALREGARALLLPSVAEVGGQLRVNLEVVDPNTQVTVYAESAEGRGPESALASIDEVNGDLRQKLGEAMGDIQANGKPLEQTTTSNLDALRAYTRANDAQKQGRMDDSRKLLDLAIERDPKFAMAYSARAHLATAANDYASARRDYASAMRLRDRLSLREALRLDAWEASLVRPADALAKWKTVSAMFPDDYSAYYQYSRFNWAYFRRYSEAYEHLQPALTPKNPRLASAHYLAGLLAMGNEKFDLASASFTRYQALGKSGFNLDQANVHAARRDYERARQVLAKQPKSGVTDADLEMRLPEVNYAADRGRLDAAIRATLALEKAASSPDSLQARTFQGMRLVLSGYTDGAKALPGVRAFVSDALSRAGDLQQANLFQDRYAALYGAALAARLGDGKFAAGVADALRAPAAGSGYPALVDLVAIVDAEVLIAAGKPQAAVAILGGRVDGSELFQVHATLLRAHLAAKDDVRARQEATWLAGHRGRAYVEWGSQFLQQPGDLVESNLAILSLAEIDARAGDPKAAGARAAQFRAAWPQAPGFVSERLRALP